MNPLPTAACPGPAQNPPPDRPFNAPRPAIHVPGGRVLAFLFGVLLPAAALGIELSTGMAEGIVNPIPTLGHAIAVGLVPCAHLLSLLALGRARRRPPLRLAASLNAAALAIGLVYAVLFAPITPFALVGILAFGFGLLPLSPLTSVIAALCLRSALRRAAGAQPLRARDFWPAFSAALLALAALQAPSSLTEAAVHRLAQGDSAALRRLRLLAPLGGEHRLLRGAYSLPPDALTWAAFDRRGSGSDDEEPYRLAYYRVTGRPFNSVPAPRLRGIGLRDRSDTDDTRDWTWDDSLGTQQVGRRLRALHLAESRLDARLENAPALGYVEWTLVFRNDHAFDQREARALIQLPPGAAVSRLTLWVRGEEREAAWGGPAQVVQAYRSVAVVQRRDPVLVTAQGPDRVLMQCFPIEPRGGLMKVRLGITLPLSLLERQRAHLLLPRFIEQNFSAPDSFSHQLRVEADAALDATLGALRTEASRPGRAVLHGALSPADLATGIAPLSIARPHASASTWTPALPDPARIVTQTFRRQPPSPGPVILVVSGSADLAPAATALHRALRDASVTPFTALYHAGDEVRQSSASLDPRAQARWLADRDFVGGQDDTPALLAALDDLTARGGGTLVWLHAGQPLAWHDSAALEQSLTRRSRLARIVSMPAVAAPNLLLEKVAAHAPLATFPRVAGLPDDLARLLRELHDGRLVAERTAHPASDFAPTGKRVSDHLSRLWARDEVHRLLATGDSQARDTAQRLALATQIVTPVSGAVVLETDAQYTANDLAPSDAKNSPVVPEPATYGLFMSGTLMLWAVCRRRRLRVSHPAAA